MFKIAVVTTTRAEFGLLYPFLKRVLKDDELELELLVSGTHLSHQHGFTINEIVNAKIPISCEIPILSDGNTPYDISRVMANAINGFADYFRVSKPDILLVSGDRTEMLGVACAALNEHIPIAHYSGGEVTMGAVDDCIRHSLTKMSYLHFTTTDIYSKRVIQLGESPNRVFNVGALGRENIRREKLLEENELRQDVGIPLDTKYVVVTLHPVTLDNQEATGPALELCRVMEEKKEYYYLITKANADVGGNSINNIFADYVASHDNATLVDSLGMLRYLSALKYAEFVLGNSSSGMVEAPILGTPTINIGDRQKGRIVAETIVNCAMNKESIIEAIDKAQLIPHIDTNIYGDGDTSKKMVQILKEVLKGENINLKKEFYDT
ncbi:MAG: UDP-N-acetylglucosamine 2-epimerase (hydrolyzing) [Lachnospiraceae bacterium]|nr:UDP-N-acetylglucosamine 2-epimerase (hydrolyzing) [Lachnospiraceae bacterium]